MRPSRFTSQFEKVVDAEPGVIIRARWQPAARAASHRIAAASYYANKLNFAQGETQAARAAGFCYTENAQVLAQNRFRNRRD